MWGNPAREATPKILPSCRLGHLPRFAHSCFIPFTSGFARGFFLAPGSSHRRRDDDCRPGSVSLSLTECRCNSSGPFSRKVFLRAHLSDGDNPRHASSASGFKASPICAKKLLRGHVIVPKLEVLDSNRDSGWVPCRRLTHICCFPSVTHHPILRFGYISCSFTGRRLFA